MSSPEKVNDSSAPGRDTSESILARLALTPTELAAVKQQGFISREQRSPENIVFKLRFRLNGRQRVKYVGDAAAAEALRQELRKLQHPHVLLKNLRAVSRAARKICRQEKLRLVPLVEQLGLKFHGRAVRRPRRTSDREETHLN